MQWLVADHLGTPRIIADLTGHLAGIKRHDYLPFGEELKDGTGGRTTAQGYSQPDGVRQGFTGYEKDGETGLNFAQNRYQSPTMGRFTTPDEPFADQHVGDPQSWNLYAYTRNNPLRYTDPNDRGILDRLKNLFNGYGFRTDEQVQQLEDKWRNYLREQEKAAGGNLINCPLQGQCQKVNIDSLSRNDVFSYAADLKESIQNGTVQNYTPEQVQEIVGATTPAPGLKGDPYHPDTVNDRVRPQYKANPAHDPKSPLFNPRKTPEPSDAASVYQNSVRADMGTWYGKGTNGKIYRYFSDNAGGVHFSGTVPKSQVPKDIRKQLEF